MAGYAIFLPGVQGANPAHLAAVGLDAISAGAEFADVLDGSPDSKRGMLAIWRTGDASRDGSMSARDYDWRPAKADKKRGLAARRFWFGVLADKPVKPLDLYRKTALAGYGIDMADGQVWIVPSLENLPHKIGLDEDGEVCRMVEGEYRELAATTQKYAVAFFDAIDKLAILKASRPGMPVDHVVKFTLADSFDFCCDVLAINYRLSRELIDLLGLIDEGCQRNIVKAAIDLPCLLKPDDRSLIRIPFRV